VLASLDATDTASAVGRLTHDLGVEPELVASALTCLVAQHLVRRICTECRETYYASADEIAALGRPEEEAGRRLLARGRGCPSCAGTGYDGWAGVFELLPATDEIRALVRGSAATSAVREAAARAGMSTLREEAVGLCLDGVTTVPEVQLLPRD
jgi:type II secretory ATPase GspE/PulE/Tfp pilus assembly ATPase PilB-like protein